MNLTFTSAVAVELVQQTGSDLDVVHAARVSTRGQRADEPVEDKEAYGLISYLMRNSHASPFEHGSFTVRVHAPIAVFREWHRHRVWSFSEESARYKQLEPVFYLPPRERPLIRGDGFRSASPVFSAATDLEYEAICALLTKGYEHAYGIYEQLLSHGCDRGLARDVLGVGIYSSCYCTANPRSILAFLELRTDHPEAKRPSKPLYEIRVAADQLEVLFARHWPLTYKAWVEHGRMAP